MSDLYNEAQRLTADKTDAWLLNLTKANVLAIPTLTTAMQDRVKAGFNGIKRRLIVERITAQVQSEKDWLFAKIKKIHISITDIEANAGVDAMFETRPTIRERYLALLEAN